MYNTTLYAQPRPIRYSGNGERLRSGDSPLGPEEGVQLVAFTSYSRLGEDRWGQEQEQEQQQQQQYAYKSMVNVMLGTLDGELGEPRLAKSLRVSHQ